jgi:hypothetical protein
VQEKEQQSGPTVHALPLVTQLPGMAVQTLSTGSQFSEQQVSPVVQSVPSISQFRSGPASVAEPPPLSPHAENVSPATSNKALMKVNETPVALLFIIQSPL